MSMTVEEALEVFNSCCNDIYKVQVATHTAIKALEEIQQYRAIGTVSEFRELKEKATAIKSDGFSDHLLNMGYTKGMKDGYAKAIEEFAEKICDVCCEESMTVILENRVKADVLTLDGLTEIVWEIAKELKGE